MDALATSTKWLPHWPHLRAWKFTRLNGRSSDPDAMFIRSGNMTHMRPPSPVCDSTYCMGNVAPGPATSRSASPVLADEEASFEFIRETFVGLEVIAPEIRRVPVLDASVDVRCRLCCRQSPACQGECGGESHKGRLHGLFPGVKYESRQKPLKLSPAQQWWA